MAKTFRNIYRAIRAHRLRFLMIAFVIAVGITSFNGMIASFVNLDLSYKTAFEEYGMASFTVQTANPGGTGSDAWIDYANLTNYLNSFKANETRSETFDFELRIVYDLNFEIRGHRQYGRIIGYNTTDEKGFRSKPDVNSYLLVHGNEFTATSTYRNVCLMENRLWEFWKYKENDFLAIGKDKIEFQVLGSFSSPEYLLNTGGYDDIFPSPRRFGVVMLPLRSAQQLLNVPGRVNEISIKLDKDLSLNVREDIAEDLKDYLEQEHDLKLSDPVDVYYQPAYYFLRMDMEEAREMGYTLPVVIIGMAMGSLYVLLGRMVVAERKDIGVSQALGYSRRYIIGHYVGIAMVISIAGTIIGTVIGVLFAAELSTVYLNVLSIKFSTERTIDWFVVGIGIVLGLLTGFLGGYLPVRNAIQPVPAESLRFDPSLHITSGKKPLVERMMEKVGIKLSVTGFKLPVRNFFRSKRRTFSSIIGVIISVSLISMGFGMADSMIITMNRQYDEIEDWDLKITYAELPTNSTDIITELNKLDGVSAATYQLVSGAVVSTNTSADDRMVQLVGLHNYTGLPGGYMGHNFIFESGEFDPDGVVLPKPVADMLDVWTGDYVNLAIPVLTKLVQTAPLRAHFEMLNISFLVSGIIDEFNGLVAFLSLEKLSDVSNFPGSPCNNIMLKLDNPSEAKMEEIKDYIYTNLSYNVRIISTNEEENKEFRSLLDLLYTLMLIVAFFAVFLAMAVVYNTVYINLQERKRELATLLTMGTPNRKIIINVTFENVIVTAIGSVIGLIFGYIMLWFFMDVVLDMEFFRIKLLFTTGTIMFSIFATLLGVLIAEYFPLKGILNLNLAEATKERVV
ncbi:MAG: ABC transporter permease [Candidatus Hodarchaeales archaeon]